MNEPLSNSELLCAFVDGELDTPGTDTLFYAVAQSQELQTELRQLIALRGALQGGLLQAPDHLKNSILQMTSIPTSETQKHLLFPAFKQSFADKIWPMLLSAATGSLITMLFFFYGMHRESQPSVHSTLQKTQLANHSILEPASQNTSSFIQQKKIEHSSTKVLSIKKQQEPYSVSSSRPSTPTEIHTAELSGTKHSLVYSSISLPIQPIAASPMTNSWSIHDQRADDLFHLQFRGFATYSLPHPDIASPSNPPVNNAAVALLYQLSEKDAIGIEVGQENFLQEYDGIANTDHLYYQQNYLGLWAGMVYQHSFGTVESLAGIQPFVQGTMGANRTGPMGRGIAGIQFRDGRLSSLLGVEGTILLYRYQQQWFITRKLGITYGLSFYF